MHEIIVEGTPRSLQAKGPGLTEWRRVVNEAAKRMVQPDDRLEYVDVWTRIFHFCFDWSGTSGDLDNIAKPILDSIAGVAFFNDNQVFEVMLRRTDLARHGIAEIVGATPLLAERLERALTDDDRGGFVYIAIGTDVDHTRMP